MTYRSSTAIALLLVIPPAILAQDRLKTMAGYDAAQRIARDAPSAITGAITGVAWIDEGRAFEYDQDGKHYRYEVSRRAADVANASGDGGRGGRGRGSDLAAPDRGRQFNSTLSPDRKLKAYYTERNVWIGDAEDRDAHAVTTDGSVAGRIK